MRKGTTTLEIVCELNEEYFAPWEELTDEQKAIFEKKQTRCEGIGLFGWWCTMCDFLHDVEIVDNGW